MAIVRTLFNFIVAGALLGVLAATLVFPRLSVWYNTPATKALCDCAETTRQTADALISAQLTSCAVGAGVGLVVGLAYLSTRRRKRVPAAVAPPAVPPASR